MKRGIRQSAIFLFAATPLALGAIPGDDCKALRLHGKRAEAQTCFTRLTRAGDPLGRAEGFWGLGRYSDANVEFRAAEKSTAKPAIVKTEWGNLFFERYQPADAAKLFEEAIEADGQFARAYLGLAQVASLGFDKKAQEFARQALQRDAQLHQAHELLAYLALEDNEPAAANGEAQKAIAISGDALDGMAVLASADWLGGKTDSEWERRILQVNPSYGQAYATGAHFFEINRRYEEAIGYYRKALALDEVLWSARSLLGVNLMRLGRSEEA
jgi:tetratricopeptide (TPR) repeat protein